MKVCVFAMFFLGSFVTAFKIDSEELLVIGACEF